MAIQKTWRTLIGAAFFALAAAGGNARAEEIPLVTGEHWSGSSEEVKKAYLVGMANLAHIERAYAADNPPSDEQSLLPRMQRGLRGQSLDSVRETLNSWYAAHPDRLQRPVIETIWFEMVVPGLQQGK